MPVSLDQVTQQLITLGLISTEDVKALLSKIHAEDPRKEVKSFTRLLVRQKKLTVFQAQQLCIGKGESLVFGNYVILDKLGRGSMGVVLKAEHRRMKRTVALKILSPALTKSPEMTRRFQREVEVAAKVEHPNIVTAHDADEANGTPFLVMQYIEGTDLLTLVKQHGPLSVDKALLCLLQTARGLEHAHQCGIVHRDVKPANLLLDEQGTIRILDLGMARMIQNDSKRDPLTGVGQIMGTVDFMAPEQAMDSRFADGRADIYALGMTLWYLLTGRPAYEGDTIVKKLMAHQNEPIPSLSSACPQASLKLEAVFEKMVAKSSEARYQKMAEVIADLKDLTQDDLSMTLALTAPEEDTRFSEFLRGIESTNKSSLPTNAATAKYAGRDVETDTRIHCSQIEIKTPPPKFLIQPLSSAKRTSRRQSRFPLSHDTWIVGGGLTVLLLWVGMMILAQAKLL